MGKRTRSTQNSKASGVNLSGPWFASLNALWVNTYLAEELNTATMAAITPHAVLFSLSANTVRTVPAQR